MKKMYNNPKTEAVELLAGNVLAGMSTGEDQHGQGGEAPARKTNPLQGQIKF